MNMRRIEQWAGTSILALIVVGCAVVLLPFVTAILWAAILCFCTWPLYLWLEKQFNGNSRRASSVMTALIAAVMVIPFALVGFTFAENLSRLAAQLDAYRVEGIPAPPAWLDRIPLLGEYLKTYWTDLSQSTDKAMIAFKHAFAASKGWLLQRSIDLGQGILQLTLSVLIAFFFYRHGELVVRKVSDGVKRIAGDYSQYLLVVAGNTIKGVVYGILGTALIQGIAAAIGFHIAGIPSAMLLGLLTFFLSMIPFAPVIAWVPPIIWLFYHHHPMMGVFLALWGLFWVNGTDNLLRPYLISRGGNLPFILVLLGVLGGIAGFGFIGIFLGPTLLAVGYALIKEFGKGRAATAQTTSTADPPR